MKHLLLTTIAFVVLVGCVSETNYSGTYVSESPLVHDVNVTLSENGEFTLISEENTETVMGDWTIKGKIIELNPKKNIRIYEEMKAQLNDDNTFSIGFGESQITGNWVKKEKMVHLNIKNGGESIKFKFEKNELIMLDQIADLKLIKEGSKKIKDDYSKLDFTETLTINSAVILGDLAKVKLAVESGLDPNTPVGGTSNEMPMLNWASMGKNTELIKYLIDKGADVNSKNKDGLTPLMFAGNKGRGTNALLLIESGANLFAKTSKQATCAHYLSYCLMPELINILIDRGVDFNQKDNRGRIPLMWASSNLRNRNERLVKNDEIKKAIEILISQTEDINEKDHQGLTALHQANDVLFAELLIKQGANINIKDNEGLTPLDTASLEKPYFGKNTRLVELLKSKAAKSGADDSLKVAIKVWNEKALIKHINNGANPNQKL
ncbi:ankyrin repeat domain-containing protein, partial [bacterium]|nr:ankyrin repeat domain-containing protein [bacterium]